MSKKSRLMSRLRANQKHEHEARLTALREKRNQRNQRMERLTKFVESMKHWVPNFKVLWQDHTEYWTDETLAKKLGAKIFAVSVFNENSFTYLCEMTPSYYLAPIHQTAVYPSGTDTDSREVEEAEEELMCEAQNEGDYIYVLAVDKSSALVLDYGAPAHSSDYWDIVEELEEAAAAGENVLDSERWREAVDKAFEDTCEDVHSNCGAWEPRDIVKLAFKEEAHA